MYGMKALRGSSSTVIRVIAADDYANDMLASIPGTFNTLRHLTVNAVAQFPNSLHIAFHCFGKQRGSYTAQGFVILASSFNFHDKGIAERLFLLASAVCVSSHFKITKALQLLAFPLGVVA
jgi:hypothetical protein